MQVRKTLKIVLLLLLFLAVAAYIIYAFVGMKSTNPDELCQDVVYIFDEEGEDAVVDSATVTRMLTEAGVYPQGKKMGSIDLKEIEKVVMKNPFVTSVDCYGNNNGMKVGESRLCLKIKQMVPVLLVFDNRGAQFYVDNIGNIIDTDSLYPNNLLVANGEINRNYVISDLMPLAVFIKQDDFWNSQIEQVYVEYDKGKNRVATLVPRVGEQRIFMGPLDKFDKKLARLRKFYERGLSVVGWNKYSVLNLEYDNQVVGIIKGQEQKATIPDEPEGLSEKQDEGQQKADETKTDETDKRDEVMADKPQQKEDVQTEGERQKADAKKDETKKEEVKKDEGKREETKKKEENKEEPKKN